MTQVLFVVHGMGNDADGPLGKADRKGWAKDVEATLRGAVAAYPGIVPTDLIVEPILYDDVFQAHALQWQELAESLKGTPFAQLTSFMDDAADGDFLWGSVGDIVQYRGLAQVRAHVITSVASQIADAVNRHGIRQSYSILAHSLGTAVAHDAVVALATRAIHTNTVLQPPNFVFSNFFAIANVSRLLYATDADFYQQTPVRPFDSGLASDRCAVNYYGSFRHVADPIPSVLRFAPRGWAQGRFQNVELRHFRDVNVHGFLHYLEAPQVCDRILTRLFPAAVTRPLRAARFGDFADYLPPHARDKQVAVETAMALLDRVSGQAHGKLELDMRAIAKAVWDNRNVLLGAVAGLV